MECTQKLECTQDLYSNQTESKTAEQIGYLGICGTKYPVKRGPNKVGRDSQTCNIVLNLNSISRQHAVINILTKEEFMLMDLDSANKTKLIDKTLQPYIPYALKNGDTIQFGQVFGIFRLLDDDNDLPMTQAIDIPETPVASKFASRLNNGTVTTIPESPDVSDKEDSFLAASQPRTNPQIKNLNNIFIKPLQCPKKANINSKSMRRSDDPQNNVNDLTQINFKAEVNQTKDDIFDMETQVPESHQNKDLIYSVDTQIPSEVPLIHSLETQVFGENEPKKSSEHKNQSIYNLETQVCDKLSPNIYSLETQITFPENYDNASDKRDNKQSIHNCDTQIPENKPSDKDDGMTDMDDDIFDALTQVIPPNKYIESNENDQDVDNTSENEFIEFNDINTHSFDEGNASQPLVLSEELIEHIDNIKRKCLDNNQDKEMLKEEENDLPKNDIHILPTQKIAVKDDDLTDCEDDIFDDYALPNQETSNLVEEHKCISNLPTQVIPANDNIFDFQDMPTQVVEEDNTKSDSFGELLTQKIDEVGIYNLPTQQIPNDDRLNTKSSNEFDSPFKVPFAVDKVNKLQKSIDSPLKVTKNEGANESTYYKQTQDLVDDLCTQKLPEEKAINIMESILVSKKSIRINLGSDDELISNTREVENKLSQHENETSPKRNNVPVQINHTKEIFVLKDQGSSKAPNMKLPCDLSDTEITPKKLNPFKFMNTDLPNSQEIKSSITLTSRIVTSESSTDSESEENNSNEGSPITFQSNKRSKGRAKQDLTKKFDIKSLPDRIMTRQRKPTIKVQESIRYGVISKDILKSKLLEDIDNIDSEILIANIAKLKNAAKHSKHDANKTTIKIKKEPVKAAEDIKSANENINSKIKGNLKKICVKQEMKVDSDKKETRKNKTINVIGNKSYNGETTSIVRTRRQKAQSLNGDNNSMKSTIDQPIHKNDELITCRQKSQSLNKDLTFRNTKDDNKPITKKETKRASNDSSNNCRSKRNTKKETLIEDSKADQELEVRRSKRQKNIKASMPEKRSKKENSKIETARREQSTVYNLSSESMNDSRNPKRSLTDDIEVQNAKRPRSLASVSIYSGLRSTPARAAKTQHVLFTAFPSEEVGLKLKKLGAVIETDVMKCTVLLTLQIKRTFKLLCAVGLGVPIVGLNWVQACADSNMLVDPWSYIMKDEAAEKRFTFSLESTLVGNRNFLKGYNISATPKVLPAAPEMKLIVECSGGVWKEGGSNWVCVSTLADKTLWPALRKKGATVVTTEFILGGVLKQKVDLQANMYK